MKVKLESVHRTDGNMPMDDERIGKEFYVLYALAGSSAILLYAEDENKAMKTSTVDNVGVHRNEFIIETRNTKYYFEMLG